MQRRNDPTTAQIYRELSVYDQSPQAMDRRRFLKGALALGGATALIPSFLADPVSAGPALGTDDRILVVILMGGGNDGFKMISPLENSDFVSTRGSLADDPGRAHSLGEGIYLNEHLPVIKNLWDQGNVAAVLGVGNPNDDHSHFSSMASWMAADLNPPYYSGWLGRFIEGAGYDDFGAMAVGDGGVPLHLRTPNVMATAISSWGDLFGAEQSEWNMRRYRGMHRFAEGNSGLSPWVDAAGDIFSSAISVAKTVNPAYEGLESEDGLVRELAVAAGLINLDVGARIIGVSYGDFDHHDDQAGPYQARMEELNAGISRFYENLNPAFADRVTLMTFSEFGRSFMPNGSNGTDHGTASNLMMIGSNVNGGFYGEMPNFAQSALDDWGDVEHTVDFRSYYATALEGCLGGDSREVLGATYENLGIFAGGAVVQPPIEVPALMCMGQAVTVDMSRGQQPTNGRDVILGTDGDDVIAAGGGDDLICAEGGNDTVWGQGGDDEIHGGSGSDKLRGGDNNDTLYGDSGGDDLNGGRGDDRVYGGSGDDTAVRGGTGNDYVDGGVGNDALISGNGGTDEVIGGAGNDKLAGGPRPDRLYGGDGDDFIRGNKGSDQLFGEGGNDDLRGGGQSDMLSGGSGTDACNGGTESDSATECEGDLVSIP